MKRKQLEHEPEQATQVAELVTSRWATTEPRVNAARDELTRAISDAVALLAGVELRELLDRNDAENSLES